MGDPVHIPKGGCQIGAWPVPGLLLALSGCVATGGVEAIHHEPAAIFGHKEQVLAEVRLVLFSEDITVNKASPNEQAARAIAAGAGIFVRLMIDGDVPEAAITQVPVVAELVSVEIKTADAMHPGFASLDTPPT